MLLHNISKLYVVLLQEYIATMEKPFTMQHVQRLLLGVDIEGVKVVPKGVEILNDDKNQAPRRLKVVVAEGKKHEVS